MLIIKRILFLLAILWTSVAISGCERWSIKNRILAFQRETVAFPSGMIKCDGIIKDYPSFDSNMPKLVIFIDSTQCTSCRINQISAYSSFAKESAKSQRYLLAIIIQPQKDEANQVIRQIERSRFPVPVYIDTANVFRNNNPYLGRDARFHAFLTDSNNSPILIGDPTSNKKSFELFYKVLLKQLQQ